MHCRIVTVSYPDGTTETVWLLRAIETPTALVRDDTGRVSVVVDGAWRDADNAEVRAFLGRLHAQASDPEQDN